jgi:cytochrome c-type biogenesis protein CcmH
MNRASSLAVLAAALLLGPAALAQGQTSEQVGGKVPGDEPTTTSVTPPSRVPPSSAVPSSATPASALAPSSAAVSTGRRPRVPARTTLGDVEDEVMCPVCGTPLNVSESPQAQRERAYIRRLISRGKTKDQVKQALVDQFGPSVLALPDTDQGVNWAVYAIPIVLGLMALGGLGFAVQHWRGRGPGRMAPAGGRAPVLSGEDQARLDRELARLN